MKRFLAGCILICASSFVWGQHIKEMEFKNQEITDILLALASMSGNSIVPDETVTGNASYFFTETDFESALRVFLSTYKLYFTREKGVYYVSRIRTAVDRESGAVSMDAVDVDIQLLIRSLSRAIGKTILFDALPRAALTVHASGLSPEAILEILTRQYPDFAVERTDTYYYLRNTAKGDQKNQGSGPKKQLVERKGEAYSLLAEKARFLEVLQELFSRAGQEYSLLLRTDSILENLYFREKSFEELLRLVLDQVGADYQKKNGMYFIFEIQKRDILKKFKTTLSLPLTYLSVQELPNLLPQELASQNLFRLDKQTNTVILSGSTEEIEPIRSFILSVDKPQEGKNYYRYDLKHLKVKEAVGILPGRFTASPPVVIPDTNSFVVLLSGENKAALDEYLAVIDSKNEGYPVRLKFITTEALLKNLPPSVTKEEIVATNNPSTVFFVGSQEKYKRFLRELEIVDRPVPQIRYELLVVQYQKSKSLTWNSKLDVGKAGDDASTAFVGSMDNLLALSFDIVSNFGYQFAAKLNVDLGISNAQVLADTTLNGLSGQQLKFQNTNTYRYRDFEVDADTGQLKSTGVTRELTSGLIIGINGWSSGDGMITMDVASTVSKRGADVSSQSGNPPSTYEKVINTHVRTPTGKPVIIGGLIQQDVDVSMKKVPVLGDIPLLGYFFQSKVETMENTEMVIYIVPHLEYPDMSSVSLDQRFEQLYTKFVRKQ
jgi:type II secretory pathway component GspD/PulD (secretin)